MKIIGRFWYNKYEQYLVPGYSNGKIDVCLRIRHSYKYIQLGQNSLFQTVQEKSFSSKHTYTSRRPVTFTHCTEWNRHLKAQVGI